MDDVRKVHQEVIRGGARYAKQCIGSSSWNCGTCAYADSVDKPVPTQIVQVVGASAEGMTALSDTWSSSTVVQDSCSSASTVSPRHVNPKILSLPVLMEEAMTMCAFLTPAELAKLSCVTSWHATAQDRCALWRAYFMFLWGSEHGVNQRTQVRVMRSWTDDVWTGPWPLAVGFCGARSPLDHLFWFLPMFRYGFMVEHRRTPPPPQPLPLRWQAVCHMRARPFGAARCRRCMVCNVLEVTPPGPAPQHFRRVWTRPCACAPLYAHRTCLERQLLGNSNGLGCLQVRINDAVSPKQALESSCSSDLLGQLRCVVCGAEFRTSTRFPENLFELVIATLGEWRWVVRRMSLLLVFFVWMYSLASHYCGKGFSSEVSFILLLTACMMNISLSQRFHCGVQKIWHTPHRWRYLKLFGLFASLNYLVSIRAIEPSMWLRTFSGEDAEAPAWRRLLHSIHAAVRGSLVGAVVLSGISMLHMATASGVIFLFWKTSLRVPTVADADSVQQDDGHKGLLEGGARAYSRHDCGLCQLGLCLDNTFM